MDSTAVSALDAYIAEIKQQFLSGHAREHAYRPALKQLLSSFEDAFAVNDPKRSAHGNPDFIILKESNQDIIRGYAEAKDITVDLDKTVKTEQLRRYAGYDKLLLTNYIDFRFFRNGEQYQSISIGKLSSSSVEIDETNLEWLLHELEGFLDLPPEEIKSGKRLAKIMGGKAIRVRKSVESYLTREDEKKIELDKMYHIMQELLIPDLSPAQFADMYAQTLVYGLFIARYHDKTPDNFTRQEARDLVSRDNPFLFDFFDHIAGPRFDKRLTQVVDELCEVFRASNVHKIIERHLRLFELKDEKDPVIHFYEDFLAEYDPAERKKKGAYYTPVPVVDFIISSVDEVLKRDFDIRKGISDTSRIPASNSRDKQSGIKAGQYRVQILDPSVGTATFLDRIIKRVHTDMKEQGQQGLWPSMAMDSLLPRLHGFELMMVPYVIAHLKLSMTLEETGITKHDRRLQVYLTNTLAKGVELQQGLFDFMQGLAETVSKEAVEASKIKANRPVMVVVGNPPYSGESSNKGLADELTAAYKKEPGTDQRLNERNSKWINDDYVKFMAFAEHMIAKNGEGVVGMITNHAYLDNPTFRGMRWHLAKTFDKIYILDLHGNTKKKEVAPDGGKDQNVFNIMQGVAIFIGVKTGQKRVNKLADVYHADIYGTRKQKFSALEQQPDWQQIELDKRMYYFANKNTDGKKEYDKGFAINELFIVHGVGLTTAHDNFVIDESRKVLLDRFEDFRNSPANVDLLHKKFDVKQKTGWDITAGWKNIQHHELEQYVKPIAYRPFDNRYVFYEDKLVWRTVRKVMKHMIQDDNFALMVCRQQKTDGFYHALVHNDIVESSYVSNKTSEIGYSFPLFLYHDDGSRTPNFHSAKLKEFAAKLTREYEPESIIDYIYAVLHSPSYRQKYKEFLKADFPRIPAPKSDTEFERRAELGKQLRELHLMKSPILNDLGTTYPIAGSDEVEKVSYEEGKVWINSTQYFGNVPEAAWNFYIGGYQPAQKWLKDRKTRKLTSQEIEHYQKTIKVLIETDRIMKEIEQHPTRRNNEQ